MSRWPGPPDASSRSGPSGVVAHSSSAPAIGLVVKLARYTTVSAISTATTLSLLGVLVLAKALSPGWANLVATGVGTIPSFELNRRWVWGKGGRRSMGKEVLPFCLLSFSGLALSTAAVSLSTAWAQGRGFGTGQVALVAETANLVTFGSLWVVQFFMLDRLLFRPPAAQHVAPPAAVAEAPGANTRPAITATAPSRAA